MVEKYKLDLPHVQSCTMVMFCVTEKCQDALGMQTGEIPDEAITASSSFDLELGPASAR